MLVGPLNGFEIVVEDVDIIRISMLRDRSLER